MKRKFPLAPMGVLAPGSAHARPSALPPIDTSGNFPAHVSAKSPSNISPNLSEVISKVSEFFLGCGLLVFFGYLVPHAKFRNPRTTFEITLLFHPKVKKCGG